MAMGTAKSVWSGHSCPLPLTLELLLILVRGVDTLRHGCGEMGRLLMRRVKSKGKIKIRVKGSGQECPLHTKTELRINTFRVNKRGKQMRTTGNRSKPRRLRTLPLGHANRCCGSQFHAVPAFILGAIESLIGGLDHLFGLTIARTWLGNADADRN
jgi:hypothetical protein